MVTVKGRMVVNVIDGRFGKFSVATLYCEIGDYVVRYDGLDQFETGTYEGSFVIRVTDIQIRKFRVGKIVEPVAYIDDLIIDDADEDQHESLPDAIPDPTEEESRQNINNTSDNAPKVDLAKEPSEVFGSIWPLGEVVKLDPTVGRSVLRTQSAYLDSAGYDFDAMKQHWIKPE